MFPFLTKPAKDVKESLLYKLRFKVSLKNWQGFDIFIEHGGSNTKNIYISRLQGNK